MRTIVLDTETTGLSPKNGDRIVEIGCVEIAQRRVTEHTFHVYLNPERDMPAEAQQIHGLSAEFLSDKPRFADIASDFLNFIRGAQLIIHNASFDIGFLDAELERIGSGKVAQHVDSVIDSLAMAKEQFSGKKNSLDALCQRFEIDITHRQTHGALKDSHLLAQVYFALTSGQQSLVMSAQIQTQNATIKVPTNLRVLPADEAEQAAHEGILIAMDKKSTALWRRT